MLARIDAGRREVRVGPTIETTGDVTADMDRIRPFYDDIPGIKPEKAGPVRLKTEDEFLAHWAMSPLPIARRWT